MSQSVFGSFKKVIMGTLFALLIGFLLIGLSMFGVTDAFISQSRDAAAVVGKEKVPLNEFDKAFRNRLSEYNKEAPERMTTKQAYAGGLHQQVADSLITEALIQLDADALGLDVNGRDALAFVENLDVFNNEITGKFDKNKMRQQLYLIDRDMTPKQLEADVHKQIRRGQTISSVVAGIVAPKIFAEQRYKFITEQRSVKLLHLNIAALPPQPDPSDEELKAFIDTNKAAYIAPQYRRFTLLRMEPQNILPDLETSEEEILSQYDYKIKAGQLGTKEIRSYQQLVANDKDQADQITAAVNAGKDIGAVVEEFGLEAPLVYENAEAGDSSDPKTGEAAYEMEAVGAQTIAGSFSGWYSVVVTNITPKIVPDLDSQRASLIQELKADKANQFLHDASTIIQDGIDQGMTIEEAGKAAGVSVASYDFISRLGQTRDGKRLDGLPHAQGIATDDKLLKEIFLADLGYDNDVFETSNKGIAAVRIDEIKESAQRPFAEVKDRALAAWRVKHTSEALAQLSNDLIVRAKAGESLEDLAAEIGAGAKVDEIMMTRAVRTPGLGAQLIINLFEARPGQTVRGAADNGVDRIIGQVLTITPNTDMITDNIAATLTEQTAQALNSDILDAYHRALLLENPARVMTENIERTLGLDQ